jgi:hypothetical protein
MDISTFPDLDPSFGELDPARAVAERVARRLLTPRGALDYAPEVGRDVRGLLSAGLDPSRHYSLRADLQAEAEDEDGVVSAEVDLVVVEEREAISIGVSLRTTSGPASVAIDVGKSEPEVRIFT